MIEFFGVTLSAFSWQQMIAIVIVLFALGIALSKSYKRLNQASSFHRASVLGLNIIAAVALLGLFLEPSVESEQKLRVRLNTTSEIISVIDTPDYWLQSQSFDNPDTVSIEINNPQQILIKHPLISQIEVIGDGLTESQWREFNSVEVLFEIPNLKIGLINSEWNKQIILGDNLLFSGQLQIPKESGLVTKKFTIKLLDPTLEKVSEVEIHSGQRFSLQAQPKLAGNLKYTLEVSITGSVGSEKRVLQHSIHTSVIRQSNAKILVIQSAPSFETKQLQNWAAEAGAKILVKTKISRDKYIQRAINFPELLNYNLSPDLFSNFDLVVMDGRGFVELSDPHRQWLIAAVAQGLGVLILADEALLTNKFDNELLHGFQFERLNETLETNLSWLDNNNRWVPPTKFIVNSVALEMRLDQKLISNSQKLVITGKGSIIALQKSYQLGHVAVNLFNQSHQWVTSGQAKAHSAYWQSLIKNIARRNQLDHILTIESKKLNFSKQLTKICIEAEQSLGSLTVRSRGDNSLEHQLLLQHTDKTPSEQCGYFWPEKSAWYQASAESKERLSSWFYVEAASNWPAHQQQQKIKATLSKQKALHIYSDSKLTQSPINLWVFWWLVVISGSLLWVERKFITE